LTCGSFSASNGVAFHLASNVYSVSKMWWVNIPTRSAVLAMGSRVGGSTMVVTTIVPALTGVAPSAGAASAVRPIAPAASRPRSPPRRRKLQKFMGLSPVGVNNAPWRAEAGGRHASNLVLLVYQQHLPPFIECQAGVGNVERDHVADLDIVAG